MKRFLKAPHFWFGKAYDLRALLLWPFSLLYESISRYHYQQIQARYPQQPLNVPVLCVGNCVVGGAGKTPIVTYLATLLKAHGFSVGLISRGYGGKIKETTSVNISQHTAQDVGDEPLLLANLAPTWIGLDRLYSAKRAMRAGSAILIMDDGLQNPMISKDLSFLVVDGQQGFGNHHLLPAGPLRESLNRALSRVDAVVIMGHDVHNVRDEICIFQEKLGKKFPVFKANLRPTSQALNKVKEQPLLAFAGIGYPQKFFRLLEESGGDIRIRQAFPDHYFFKPSMLDKLIEKARKENLQPITTLKDWIRFPHKYKELIPYFDVVFKPNDEAFFNRFVLGKIEQFLHDRQKS